MGRSIFSGPVFAAALMLSLTLTVTHIASAIHPHPLARRRLAEGLSVHRWCRDCSAWTSLPMERYLPTGFLFRGSQRPAEKPAYDSSRIRIRQPAAEKLTAFQSDENFNYNRRPPLTNTLFDRLLLWLSNLLRYLPIHTISTFWNLLTYLILGAAILIVLSRLLKTNIRGLFYKTGAPFPLDFKEVEEDVFKLNLKELIEKAVKEKKFQRAIRLSYLSVLKSLTEKHLIEWRRHKTNDDYVREMHASEFAESFMDVTRVFEYIWYGNAPLDQAKFQRVVQPFEIFIRSLQEKS
ncbi:MAG: DUF4129 domain-containing protein [bacterium]